ncbi:MAG: Mce family protein [Proteobacteria bacterium]|nr:Mce family protein [Pseudomonadota bacterium]
MFTGLFLLVLGSAIVGITLWLGHYGDETDTYIVTTTGTVSGLVEESTVLYRGVNAGKVATISFDPDDVRTILVRINVKKGLPITRGTFARLRIQGLTGLAQIELGDNSESPEPLPTSDRRPARIAMRPSLVDKLSDAGGNIVILAEELIARFNALLDEPGRKRIQHILANLETASGKLDHLEQHMDDAFALVPELSASAKQTMKHTDELALQITKLARNGQSVVDGIGALVSTGKSAGERLNQSTLPHLNELLEELRLTAAELRKLSGQLSRDPQMLLYGPLPPEPGPGEPGFRGAH